MLRSRTAIVAALLALAFAPACPADSGETDAEAASAGTTTATAPTTGAEIDQTCAGYCGAVTTACTGPNAQYSGMDTCMGSCKAFATGTADDTAGNTLGCRIYHASVAAKDAPSAAMHCTHAGPGGADICGGNCEGFCTVALDACPTTYADAAACESACAAFDMTEPYDAGDVAGDTFACRLYHLTVATTLPDAHCPHIQPTSATCGG